MNIVPIPTEPTDLADTVRNLWNTTSRFFLNLMSEPDRKFSREALEDNIFLAHGLLTSLQKLLTGVPKITGTQLENIIHQAIVWSEPESTRAFYKDLASGESPMTRRRASGFLFSDYYSQLIHFRNHNCRKELDLETTLCGIPVHQKPVFNPVFDEIEKRLILSLRRSVSVRGSHPRVKTDPSTFESLQTDVTRQYLLLRDVQYLLTGITSYGGSKEEGLFAELVKQVFSDHKRPFYKIPTPAKGSKLTPWATTIMTSQGSIGGSTEFASELPSTFFPCFGDHALAAQQTA